MKPNNSASPYYNRYESFLSTIRPLNERVILLKREMSGWFVPPSKETKNNAIININGINMNVVDLNYQIRANLNYFDYNEKENLKQLLQDFNNNATLLNQISELKVGLRVEYFNIFSISPSNNPPYSPPMYSPPIYNPPTINTFHNLMTDIKQLNNKVLSLSHKLSKLNSMNSDQTTKDSMINIINSLNMQITDLNPYILNIKKNLNKNHNDELDQKITDFDYNVKNLNPKIKKEFGLKVQNLMYNSDDDNLNVPSPFDEDGNDLHSPCGDFQISPEINNYDKMFDMQNNKNSYKSPTPKMCNFKWNPKN